MNLYWVALKSNILLIDKENILGLIVRLEVVDVGWVHVWKVVVEAEAQLDLTLLCEHDLRGRHATEIHPSYFIEVRKYLQQLIDNLPDHWLGKRPYKLQQFEQRPTLEILSQYRHSTFRVVELLSMNGQKMTIHLIAIPL